jgi:hypothetical protein
MLSFSSAISPSIKSSEKWNDIVNQVIIALKGMNHAPN